VLSDQYFVAKKKRYSHRLAMYKPRMVFSLSENSDGASEAAELESGLPELVILIPAGFKRGVLDTI
jgi:hypothetical protein